jgi:hypothetical protein
MGYKTERLSQLSAQVGQINSEVEMLKSDVGLELDGVVQTYCDANAGVSYSDGLMRVLKDPAHSSLARRYRESLGDKAR